VIAALRERSGQELTLHEGTVYPALHRLEEAGLLRSYWAEQAGRRRRLYEFTARGAAVLGELRSEWRRFSTGVQAVVGGRGDGGAAGRGRPDRRRGQRPGGRGARPDVRAGFVAGDLPGMTYTPERCAEFLEYFPDAGSCAKAAALHHWGEVVEYRVAAGVLGLLVLGAFLLWRRRARPPEYLGVLPDGFAATVATSLYGVGCRRRGPGDGGPRWRLAVPHRAQPSPARPSHLQARPGRALLQLAIQQRPVGCDPTGRVESVSSTDAGSESASLPL
jgi:PadR family transcriptional regulator PadR